jgi:stalled ribosome alternative rescue factor ArfA
MSGRQRESRPETAFKEVTRIGTDKSAYGKGSYDGRESASKKVQNYWESPSQVDHFTGESFDLVTAR